MARMKSRLALPCSIAAGVVMTLSLLSPRAQAQAPVALNSHEVHSDGSITFRYEDAHATKVLLVLDGVEKPLPLEKDKNNPVWSLTTPPLAPEIYGYSFEVDGQARLDPMNTTIKPNLIYLSNSITVPGKAPQLWDAADVPHGEVHHHFYTSKVVQNLPGGQSDFF